MHVVTINIPARGKQKIESRGTLGYLSGEVPRLIIRAGSDAFDIWEGQCLPFAANSVYICNPFGRDATVAIIHDAPVCYSINPENQARHHEKTCYHMRWAPYVADPAKRLGMVFLSTKGRYEITPVMSGHESWGVRVTTFLGASPDFLSAKPAGCFESGQNIMSAGFDAMADGCITVSGLFTDADVTAWLAATPGTEAVVFGHYSNFSAAQRVITEPGRAVSFSVQQSYVPLGGLLVRDLGQMAQDYD